MTTAEASLTIRPHPDDPGLEMLDRIERRRYSLRTPAPVDPTPAETAEFRFPVSKAVSFTTAALTLPQVIAVYARGADGEIVAKVDHLDSASLGPGRYTLELSTQIKTYLRVAGPLEISAGAFETTIEFPDPTAVRLGVRSLHRRPAATITTTGAPRDAMSAVETFGSALKTTTPERSYPTLRGHPPAVEVGSKLAVPDGVESPDTGVTLEIPPRFDAIYTAAPLVYYLGADLEPASTPRLVTDSGFAYRLTGDGDLTAGVERTLKQLFVLDCVTRTEGLYDLTLHERQAIEDRVDLDLARLYDRPLAEQVAAYLRVPYGVVADQVPRWQLAARVAPRPTSVRHLPYLIDDLAVVRPTDRTPSAAPTPTAGREFTREGALVRSAGTEDETAGETSYVEVEPAAELSQAWVGDGVPIGASTPTPAAFRNRFEREQTDGALSITVVINDARMEAERELVDEAYGNREDLPFDVSISRDLTAAELRECLQGRSDFLHFIGHTDEQGMECADGRLDLRGLPETNAAAFLLNSCNSYEQGLSLVEAGAIGGIVTLNEVINDAAVRIGGLLARLLNSGFPLRAALGVAADRNPLGGQYTVVGDGSLTVAQPASRTPLLLELTGTDDGYDLTFNGYATSDANLGSLFLPFVSHNDCHYLNTGTIDNFSVSEEELRDILRMENMPVDFDGELRWSGSLLEAFAGD